MGADKLVAQGLLEASYRHLTTHRGPGAGRPAKVYRRSSLQFTVVLPAREYELAARVFATTLAAAPPAALRARLRSTARAFGARLGRDHRRRTGSRPGRATLPLLLKLLREYGYEPFRAPDGTVRLRNCPFDSLARDFRPLMCDTNQALLAGLVRGRGLTGCATQLDPQSGMCCVAFRQRKSAVPRSRN